MWKIILKHFKTYDMFFELKSGQNIFFFLRFLLRGIVLLLTYRTEGKCFVNDLIIILLNF